MVNPFPVLPPTHGGRTRSLSMAIGVARAGADVDVLFPWAPGLPLKPFRHRGLRLHPHRFAAAGLVAALPERLAPPQVALALQPFAAGPRQRIARLRPFDAIQFELVAHARWMRRAAGARTLVYSAHNVELDHLVATAHWPARGGLGRRAIADLERRAVRAADLVVVTTDDDARRLEALYGAPRRMVTIPQGHDPATPGPDERGRGRALLGLGDGEVAAVFVGGPSAHNREARAFLEREVAPRLPDHARIVTAGRCAPRSRPGRGRVQDLGFVDDLGPVLAAADLAVNPVGGGSGQALKMPQYLAHGLAVVSTRFGARGLAPSPSVVLAERGRFAEAVAAALDGHAPPRPTAAPGPTWDEVGARLLAELERL
jgi:hypothetical protein